MLFFSPEILQHLPYDEKADVWAAGCLLYQMATLKPPFYSSNMLQLATKVAYCKRGSHNAVCSFRNWGTSNY